MLYLVPQLFYTILQLPVHLCLSHRARLSVNLIITQIGRENNISAEIYVSRTVEDCTV